MNLKLVKAQAKKLKNEIQILHLACRDSRVPWYAKILAVFIIGYALSPIDLIPDFIPILGHLDDLIIVPAGIILLIKMVPSEVVDEYRGKIQSLPADKQPKNWLVATVVVFFWLVVIYVALRILTT